MRHTLYELWPDVGEGSTEEHVAPLSRMAVPHAILPERVLSINGALVYGDVDRCLARVELGSMNPRSDIWSYEMRMAWYRRTPPPWQAPPWLATTPVNRGFLLLGGKVLFFPTGGTVAQEGGKTFRMPVGLLDPVTGDVEYASLLFEMREPITRRAAGVRRSWHTIPPTPVVLPERLSLSLLCGIRTIRPTADGTRFLVAWGEELSAIDFACRELWRQRAADDGGQPPE